MAEPSFLSQPGQKHLLCLKPSLEMRNNLRQTVHELISRKVTGIPQQCLKDDIKFTPFLIT